jgi:hypothetical protein
MSCARFAYIYFSLRGEKEIPDFSLSFALSEYERRTLVPVVLYDELGQIPCAARLAAHRAAGQLTARQLTCCLPHHVHGSGGKYL